MKIEIYKKENSENIYYSYEEHSDIILNFENLKKLAILFLDKKIGGSDVSYEIDCTKELVLYKNTVDDVIKSILEDDELIKLYNENKKQEK